MNCIACGQKAQGTQIKEDIEAAFCQDHYPAKKIEITMTIRCIK